MGRCPVWVDVMICWLAHCTLMGAFVRRLFRIGVLLLVQLILHPESNRGSCGEGPSTVVEMLDSLVTLKLLLGMLGVPLSQALALGSWFSRSFCCLFQSSLLLYVISILPPIFLKMVASFLWPSLGKVQVLLLCLHTPWDQQ
jgi:hypothetical protein